MKEQLLEDMLIKEKKRIMKEELANWEFTFEMKRNVLNMIRKTKKKNRFSKNLLPTVMSFTLVILLFGGMLQYVLSTNPSSNGNQINKKSPEKNHELNPINDPKGSDDSLVDSNDKKTNSSILPGLPNFTDLMDQFNAKFTSLLAPELYDPNFKYKEIKTKQEFYRNFTELATMEAIEQYSAPFLNETNDGLYLISDAAVSIYNERLPIDVAKIDQQTYEVKQYDKNKGKNITRIIKFEKVNGKFLITEISKR
ncbi:hypothetical protein D1B31_01390 [Neobacillus notoginsengisoli]|uniref:Uncharacterized protein n=1 Tax=Neobacillus notoginsengisoli TaxID=1578198 RepID=A0A417YZN1_9BACI|nr:hypothetical protein [Neobacillus notoginsengisoli]RHW43350.1 hypothetical protein D1B31_01390 [Neobacillus notoginsengisoli]